MKTAKSIQGLKQPLLSCPSSDSGDSSRLTLRPSSDSLSSFQTAHSGPLEENGQGWGDWISTHIHRLFDGWLVPFSQEKPSAITIEEDNSLIEESPSSELSLPEWVEPLFQVLKQTVGERPSMVNDHQQRLFFNPETGDTAWQCIEDITDGLMDHKLLNSFYEILEQALERGCDYSNQSVLNQVQEIMKSPISLDFFSKAFVIRCDHPDYKKYVYLVDRDYIPKLTTHPDNSRVNLKGTTWTNSKEDNEYIARKLGESRDCSSEECGNLCCFFLSVSVANLLVVPAVAAISCTQYGSMSPFFHAISVSCMPWQLCNDACSFWISTSVTMGLPVDCCLTGLYGLVLFNCCDQQETHSGQDDRPRFLVDKTFNHLMGKIQEDDTLKSLIDDEHTPEADAPRTKRMSR